MARRSRFISLLTSDAQPSVLIYDNSLIAIFNVGLSGNDKVFERYFQGERATVIRACGECAP